MKQKHSVTIDELGITISTGSIARLANGAVTISKGETYRNNSPAESPMRETSSKPMPCA